MLCCAYDLRNKIDKNNFVVICILFVEGTKRQNLSIVRVSLHLCFFPYLTRRLGINEETASVQGENRNAEMLTVL